MKLSIEGTSEEIKNVLQAIGSSEEHEKITTQIEALQTSLTSAIAAVLDAKETANEALTKVNKGLNQ